MTFEEYADLISRIDNMGMKMARTVLAGETIPQQPAAALYQSMLRCARRAREINQCRA